METVPPTPLAARAGVEFNGTFECYKGMSEQPSPAATHQEVVEYFTIGHLAVALGIKPVTVRLWERQGKIPPAPRRKPSADNRLGKRIYTRDEINQVVRKVKSERKAKRKPLLPRVPEPRCQFPDEVGRACQRPAAQIRFGLGLEHYVVNLCAKHGEPLATVYAAYIEIATPLTVDLD